MGFRSGPGIIRRGDLKFRQRVLRYGEAQILLPGYVFDQRRDQ